MSEQSGWSTPLNERFAEKLAASKARLNLMAMSLLALALAWVGAAEALDRSALIGAVGCALVSAFQFWLARSKARTLGAATFHELLSIASIVVAIAICIAAIAALASARGFLV